MRVFVCLALALLACTAFVATSAQHHIAAAQQQQQYDSAHVAALFDLDVEPLDESLQWRVAQRGGQPSGAGYVEVPDVLGLGQQRADELVALGREYRAIRRRVRAGVATPQDADMLARMRLALSDVWANAPMAVRESMEPYYRVAMGRLNRLAKRIDTALSMAYSQPMQQPTMQYGLGDASPITSPVYMSPSPRSPLRMGLGAAVPRRSLPSSSWMQQSELIQRPIQAYASAVADEFEQSLYGVQDALTPPPQFGAVPSMSSLPASALTADMYVTLAGAGDLYEIESSRLLLSQAQSQSQLRLSPLTLAYASQMLRDHGALSMQLQAALLRLAGPQSPLLQPKLVGPYERMLRRLATSVPPERLERAYLLQQLRAHRLGLALHQRYAMEGDNAMLRQLAAGAVPVGQQHLNEVEQMLGLAKPSQAGVGVLMQLASAQ